MTHYILQTVVFQLLFLMLYDLFFKKELFYKWNRIYLIITPILSFVLPFIKINFIKKNIPEEYIVKLPTIILDNTSSSIIVAERLEEIIVLGTSFFSQTFIWQFIWLAGMLISLGFFSYKLYKIIMLKKSGIRLKDNGITIISLPKSDTAFSFLNTIFLGGQLTKAQKEIILLHEKTHIEQHHSLDLLFFEVIKIICWFNPLVYIFQNKMILLQEFIADEKAASKKGKTTYYQGLLSQVFQTESISFINTFFNHSLIKKRIIMLQKTKSNSAAQFKYLLLLPVIGLMLVYTSCTQEPKVDQGNSVSDLITDLKVALQEGKLSDKDKKELLVLISNSENNTSSQPEIESYNTDAISFSVIDKVPTYPGCTGNTNEELKNCMSEKIQKFVQKKFNTDLAGDLGLEGRQRISIQFKIDKLGNVVAIRARAPHPSLEFEARRVISMLPKMKPGEQDGKTVEVLYSLPILFKVNE